MHPDLPQFVCRAIDELAGDSSTQSIWLVGSRANECAKDNSDWDLLVFSARDPKPGSASSAAIDVIRVGPSGNFLLDGKGLDFLLSFSNWLWTPTGETAATYTSYDLEAADGPLVVKSTAGPLRVQRKAFRLWPRAASLA